MTSIETLLSEDDSSTLDLETWCHETSGLTVEEAIPALERVLVEVKKSKGSRPLELLAWMLLYEIVDPILLLQAMLLRDDYSVIKISGTRDIEDHVMENLKLPRSEGKARKYPKTHEALRLKSDLLCPSLGKSKKRPRQSTTIIYDERVLNDTRQILQRLLTDQETSRQITRKISKSKASSVFAAILRTAMEAKMYNQRFGSVTNQLIADAKWREGWEAVVDQFLSSETQEFREASKLKVAGIWIGHILASAHTNWQAILPYFDLGSSSGNRIVLLAVMKELRLEMGAVQVENKLRALNNIDGLTKSKLAPNFWDMAGYKNLAALIKNEQK